MSSKGTRRALATVLGVVALGMPLCGCGKGSATAEKDTERQGARQAETAKPEASGQTHAPGDLTREEQAAQSQADCRLVLYVADKNMSWKEAEAFSELLADMIRTMESPSWTEGNLRNAALDHLAIPRYRECKHTEK